MLVNLNAPAFAQSVPIDITGINFYCHYNTVYTRQPLDGGGVLRSVYVKIIPIAQSFSVTVDGKVLIGNANDVLFDYGNGKYEIIDRATFWNRYQHYEVLEIHNSLPRIHHMFDFLNNNKVEIKIIDNKPVFVRATESLLRDIGHMPDFHEKDNISRGPIRELLSRGETPESIISKYKMALPWETDRFGWLEEVVMQEKVKYMTGRYPIELKTTNKVISEKFTSESEKISEELAQLKTKPRLERIKYMVKELKVLSNKNFGGLEEGVRVHILPEALKAVQEFKEEVLKTGNKKAISLLEKHERTLKEIEAKSEGRLAEFLKENPKPKTGIGASIKVYLRGAWDSLKSGRGAGMLIMAGLICYGARAFAKENQYESSIRLQRTETLNDLAPVFIAYPVALESMIVAGILEDEGVATDLRVYYIKDPKDATVQDTGDEILEQSYATVKLIDACPEFKEQIIASATVEWQNSEEALKQKIDDGKNTTKNTYEGAGMQYGGYQSHMRR